MRNDIIQKSTACIKQGAEILLNHQMGMENKASAAYLAMASWCDIKGHHHAAEFLYQQATEEREHMLKILHYINDAGGRAVFSEVTGVRQEFNSLKEIFELALQQEIKVTQSIHHLATSCLTEQDMATFNFLQWFISEQVEEEVTMRKILDFFEVIGEEGIGLYLIDKEIGNLKK